MESASQADCQEAAQLLAELVEIYSSVEPNEKQKADTNAKLRILAERLQSGDVSAALVGQLISLLGMLASGNYQQARGAIGTISQKSWAECKDWINAVKVMA